METDIVFRNGEGVAVTTSHTVAEVFGRPHTNVLRDIDNLHCSESFQKLNFEFLFNIRELPNGGSKKERYCVMTKDGFTFLAMGYTGKKAAEFKEKYIAAFNSMEKQLREGSQISQRFIQTQMQMMQQMMKLCSNMMDRVEKLEQKQLPPTKEEPADKHGVSGWDTSFMRTSSSRRQFTDYITVKEAARELGRRGLYIFQATLYEYLRNNGYTSKDENRYNCPESHCIRKGWMVSVNAGTNKSNHFGRRYFTPYLSPEFVDKLESELRMMKCSDPAGYQLTLPLGKEVDL